MLKKVKTMCAFCMQSGLAQIDTTENVVVMVCICPTCGEKWNKHVPPEGQKKIAEDGLASLFG